MKEKKRHSLSLILIIIILIAGVLIMLYPTLSDLYNQMHQSRVIREYRTDTSSSDKARNRELLRQAEAYNAKLAETGADFTLGEKKDSDPVKKKYLETLDVSDTGVMGYITVPKVHIRLPIYHDTKAETLQIAVGHLAGTSLPVGGKSTHSVLTGHTGLPTARLFTDIDRLTNGDIFQIHVLGRTLTYEVYDIRTVLPDQLDTLQIEKGRDLVTLVTCTPYGINTHRLLVTGKRIPNPSNVRETVDIRIMILIAVAVSAAVVITIIVIRKRKRYGGN